MANHIFERIAIFVIAHNETHSSHIFAQQLDTAMLDLIVINYKCSALYSLYHSQRHPEVVLHSTFTYRLQNLVAIYVLLLLVRLEYNFEVAELQCHH